MIQRNMYKFKNSARPNVFSSSAQEHTVLVFSSSAQGNGMHASRAANVVNVVAADTIFVLRLSKSGRTVGRTGSRLDGWSVGRTIGPKSEKNYQS